MILFVETHSWKRLGVGLGLGVPVLLKRKAEREGPLVSLSERLKDGSVNFRGSVLILGNDSIGGSVCPLYLWLYT